MLQLKNKKIFILITLLAAVWFSFCFPLKGQELSLINKVEGLQHSGAVHFYLEPGVVEIELFKEDRGGYNVVHQIMHASLVGPDGTTHGVVKIKGTRKERLRVDVEYEGIYTLFVSMNNDQYIRSVIWGFRTNAITYMINSGAGHTDKERQEPIVLDGVEEVFGVFFKPRKSAFEISVNGGVNSTDFIELYDGQGVLQHRVRFTKETTIRVETDGDQHSGVWELRLPRQKGTILIEGVTHGWDKDRIPLPVWTTARNHYFDLEDYHWLINPRRFARNLRAGDSGTITFSLYNNSNEDMPIEVGLRNKSSIISSSLDSNNLIVAPKATEKINLSYKIPLEETKETYRFQLSVTDTRTNKKAYSLVELRVDSMQEVTLPIQFKLFEHDQFQFAYEPDYPTDNQFYFDADNRPWMITNEGLQVLKNSNWETVLFPVDEGSVYTYPTSTIGSDNKGYVYTIIQIDNIPHLMRVESDNLKPEAVRLPASGKYKLETYMGGKESAHLPVILRYKLNKAKGSVARWAKKHKLELFIPTTENDTLSVGTPILISDDCVGTSDHSGITNAVATDGDKVHVVWGEISNPDKKKKGVPTYTRFYDRQTGELSSATLLAYAPPVNDVHNMSTLLVDTEGNHHAVIGAHGRPFQYSMRPVNGEGWTPPVALTKEGQTYVGAVLDNLNGIHLLGRMWRKANTYADVFDASLSYQYMNKDKNWTEPVAFVLPPLPGYSIYYHRVTVDRFGMLYVSLDYWSTWSPYRDSLTAHGTCRNMRSHRMIFVSANGRDFAPLTKDNLTNRIRE